MFPIVVELTAVVFTVKLADDAPPGTVIELGTNAAGLPLVKSISAPPTGAAPVRATVPMVDCPPVTVDGFSATEFKDAAAGAGL